MAGLNPRGIAEKTEVALSMTDLATAGLLNDWQVESLVGIMQGEANLLGDNEVKIVGQQKGKYEYGGFPDRMSFPVNEADELADTKYSKPLMVKVPFDCHKFKGVVSLSDETMMNSIEKGNLGAWTMQQAAPRLALDIEEYGISSNTTGGVTDFDAIDGLVKQISTPRGNSNNARGTGVIINPVTAVDISDAVLFQMRAVLPSKYWRDIKNLRYYCSPLQEGVLQYKRISQYGVPGYEYAEKDKRFNMTYAGVPVFPVPGMPDDTIILTHNKNIIWFIEKTISWELEREAKKDRYLYHVRYFMDVAFAVAGAVVAHTNIASPVVETE
jgi:hypothetical protein